MHVHIQCLIPDDIVALVAVELVGDGTAGEVVLVFADQRPLIAIAVEIVGAFAVSVTPKGVGAVHADDETGVVAVGDDAAGVAYPSAEGCTLAVAADAAGVETVDQPDAACTAHAHAADAGGILLGCTDAGLVATILKRHGAATVGATGDAGHKTLSGDEARPVNDDILDGGAILEHAEETHIFLVRQVERHVLDEMLLAVEGAEERTAHRSDGEVFDAGEVDVGCQRTADATIAAGDHVGELFQV